MGKYKQRNYIQRFFKNRTALIATASAFALIALISLLQMVTDTHPQTIYGMTAITKSTTKKRRIIFIDGGANSGDTFLAMQNDDAFIPSHYNRTDIEAYLFEVNPYFTERLSELSRQYSQIKDIQTAMWIADEMITIHLDTVDTRRQGSSIMSNHRVAAASRNRDGEAKTLTKVKAVDICRYITDTIGVRPGIDLVYLKMDIEGAEYDVLQYIISNQRCHSSIRELIVEFHWDLSPNAKYRSEDGTLIFVNKLRAETGMTVRLWDDLRSGKPKNA